MCFINARSETVEENMSKAIGKLLLFNKFLNWRCITLGHSLLQLVQHNYYSNAHESVFMGVRN
jgi:hypothetical protein